MDLDRGDEAETLLKRRLAEAPDDALAWRRLARCHLNAQEYEESGDAADEALRIDPASPDAHVVRAYAMRRQGKPEECLTSAEEAIRLAPGAWQGYAALSEAYGWPKENWPKAYEAACEAVRLGPDDTGVHKALWKTALITGRFDVQRRAVEAVLRIDPEDAWARSEWAGFQASDAGKDMPTRADAYGTGLQAAPDDRHLRQMLDGTVMMMLRGTRWLALVCLAISAALIDLFPQILFRVALVPTLLTIAAERFALWGNSR